MIQKQTIDIPFTKGIDTKSDPKLSAKPTRLENAVFSETGQGGTISKRPGSAPIGSVGSADGAASTGENQLLVSSGPTLYRETAIGGLSLSTLSTSMPCTLSIDSIVRGSTSQLHFDHACSMGLSVFAWIETSGQNVGLHVAVRDESTGVFYQNGGSAVASTASAANVKCLYAGSGMFHVYFTSGTTTLSVIAISNSSPSVLSAPAVLKTNARSASVQSFDAVLLPTGNVAVAYEVVSVNSYSLFLVNSSGVLVSSPGPATVSDSNMPSPICVAADNAGNIYVIFIGASSYLRYATHSQTTLAQGLAITTITGNGGYNSTYATAGACYNGAGGILVALNSFDGGITDVSTAIIGPTGVMAPFSVLSAGACLAGSPFLAQSSSASGVMIPIYATVASSAQPTVVIVDTSGNAVARILPALCGSLPTARLSSVCNISTGVYSLLVGQQGRISFSAGGATTTPIGISRASLTFDGMGQAQSAEVADGLFFCGAAPKFYDGNGVYEAGFEIFPDNITVNSTGGAGTGSLSAGTYQATAIYSWTDHNGRVHRSAPATPVSATAVSTGSFQVNILPLNVTSKDSGLLGSNVIIEVYRTQANGSIFYRETDLTAPLYNNKTSGQLNFTCSLSDSSIAGNEILYTTGGVLASIAPPACKYVLSRNNRLILAGLEDPFEWRYSTVVVPGEFPRFNESLGGRLPRSKGKVTAVSSLDDKVVFFCERGIWMVYGDGADATGANSTFTTPQPLPSDVGCDSWQSIVETPDGLIFHSPKGFHLLGHDLSVQYIGAEVEAYNGYAVRSALMLSDQKQVRFQLDQGSDVSTGICLAWDYFYRTWGTFPSYGGIGAVSWQNKYTRVRSDGSILQETPGAFSDSGSPYSTLIETEWIHVAGIQGFQRILNVLLLGAWDGLSNYTLTVDVGYNYDTAYDTVNDRFTVAVNSTNFSTTGPMQIRHKPRIQKCEAIRLRIQDGNISSPFSGLSLSSLALEVGVKKGAFKLPAGRTV